jgi:flagellar FliJ protein
VKFSFRLEKVKRHREILEDLAKGAYAEACMVRDGVLRQCEKADEDLFKAKERVAQVRESGGSLRALLESLQDFIDGQLIVIERKRAELDSAEDIVSERHLELVEASRNRKVLEKLEEKKREEFLKELGRREQKDIDEMVVNRFGRRG